jgi:transcriptional coactivator p15 (PC4)
MDIDQPAKPNDAPRATLAVPLTVAKFWKNRRRNESVHVTLSEYEGHPLINVRVYATGTDGIDRPTPKGIALGVGKLPELARAIAKAEAHAREIGLITGGGE